MGKFKHTFFTAQIWMDSKSQDVVVCSTIITSLPVRTHCCDVQTGQGDERLYTKHSFPLKKCTHEPSKTSTPNQAIAQRHEKRRLRSPRRWQAARLTYCRRQLPRTRRRPIDRHIRVGAHVLVARFGVGTQEPHNGDAQGNPLRGARRGGPPLFASRFFHLMNSSRVAAPVWNRCRGGCARPFPMCSDGTVGSDYTTLRLRVSPAALRYACAVFPGRADWADCPNLQRLPGLAKRRRLPEAANFCRNQNRRWSSHPRFPASVRVISHPKLGFSWVVFTPN